MGFKVPDDEPIDDELEFEFTIGSKKYRATRVKYLDMGGLEKLNTDELPLTETMDFFGKADTPVGKAIRALSQKQYEALWDAWVEDSKVSPGESGDSSS